MSVNDEAPVTGNTPAASRSAVRLGVGCITLFALPFLAVAVFAGIAFVRGLFGVSTGMPPGFAAMFALAFGGFGVAIIAAARYGASRAQRHASGLAAHPDQPWLWRDDWAEGRARSSQGAGAAAIAVFAFLWNVVSAPVLFIVPGEVADGNTAALIGLLFPIVGVGLLIWAVRMAVRSRKFRGAAVELPVVPIRPGTRFDATLHTPFPDGPPEQLTLALSCIRRRVTGSGKNRSVRESVLWQDERRLEGWDVPMDYGEAGIPFTFDIPADAPPTTPGSGNDRVFWRLDTHAVTPGVDYGEAFELPVFSTDEAGRLVPSATPDFDAIEARLAVTKPASAPERPETPTILIRPADPVGTEFVSLPARDRAPVVPLLIFMLVWWGIVAILLRLDAPLLFPVVFGFFGLLLLVFTIDLTFATTRTLVTGEGVSVRTHALGITRSRAIELADVRTVGVKVGMSQTGSATQTTKAWHDVVIELPDGKRVRVARHIPTRAEAEWVAAELRRTVGVDG